MQGTHHDDKDHRACEAPDEGFMDRDPTEVGVPIALWIQANSKAWQGRDSRTEGVCSGAAEPSVWREAGAESRPLPEQRAWGC